MALTTEELERRAFIEGDHALADALQRAEDEQMEAADTAREMNECEEQRELAERRVARLVDVLTALTGSLRSARFLRVAQVEALTDVLDRVSTDSDGDVNVWREIDVACGLLAA